MESTELEELLTNIQKLQSIMIGVASNSQEYRIQDKDEEYTELYQEIASQIEELQYEGFPIENPNNFYSLWDWYRYWKSKLHKSAVRRSYIYNLYQNVCNQIDVALYKHYFKVTSSEVLDNELEPTKIEELKLKIEQLQEIMIEVATESDTIYSIQYNDENYTKLYQEVCFKIEIIRERAISVSNTNQFRSLWQWYSFYSEQLEDTKTARREYINKLYLNIVKPIEKALRQYRSKSISSLEEFIQVLKERFNQKNFTAPITSLVPTVALSNSIETSTQNLDELSQQKILEHVSNTLSIPSQSIEKSLFAITNSTLTWTDESAMNPEIFLEQQDVAPLIMALNHFSLKVSVASDRQNVLESAGIDSAFLSNLKWDTQSINFANELVGKFRQYQISSYNLESHPMVKLLKHLGNFALIYNFSDQDVELFNQLVEKGQENFKALAASNTVGRIESPIGNPIGTGVLITNNLLLTCNHIFSQSQVQKAWVRFGYKAGKYELEKNVLELEIILNNSRFDYALLKINAQTQQKPISINETSILDSGQEICIIHHPQGNPLIISGFGQIMQVGEDYIDHNLKTDNGSSGAPIFNRQWELIAIHQGNVGIGRNFEPGSTGGIPIRAIWNQISSYLN